MESSRHKRPACSRCRHMKLKCDAGERFPAGCTRCTKAKRACSIEPGYKSPSKDDRLEELERELQNLRADLARQSSRSPRGPGTSTDPSTADPDDNTGAGSTVPPIDAPASIDLVEPQILEGIEVSPLLFNELADIFFTYLHPSLPFLPEKSQVVRDCAASPLLFWTIVAVASKASPTHSHLWRHLIGPVRRLVMSSAYLTNDLLVQIQALLILCIWPLPFGAAIDDPAWMYCGIATHKGLRIGLHRPFSEHEFKPSYMPRATNEMVQTRRNTWAACFIVNHLVSQRQGVPSTMRMDQVLFKCITEPAETFHPVLRNILQIIQKDHAFSLVLGHNEATSDGLLFEPLPIIQAYESELNTLEAQLHNTWTPALESMFLGSKLRLYSYALTKTGDRESGAADGTRLHPRTSDPADVSVYLARAYAAAMRIIELSSLGGSGSGASVGVSASSSSSAAAAAAGSPFAESTQGWSTWTSFDMGHLLYAAFFLLQITRNWGMGSDRVATDNAIRQAWATFKSCVVADNDLFSRVCGIIERVSHGQLETAALAGGPDALPRFLVKARMGANLVQDLTLRAYKHYDDGQDIFPDAIPELPLLPSASAVAVSSSMAGLDHTLVAQYPTLQLQTLEDHKFVWADMDGMGDMPQF